MRLEDIAPHDPRLVDDVHPVLAELRVDLTSEAFLALYARAHAHGLRYLAAYDDDGCAGVAGWRVVETTAAGLKLYVDDLVTRSDKRSSGTGTLLLAELEARARHLGCHVLDLDSGVQRARAHRFYFREDMTISSFHFAKALR